MRKDSPMTNASSWRTGQRTRGQSHTTLSVSVRYAQILRHRQLTQATASVDFLRELLELAQQVTAVERADDEGHLDEAGILPDPNVGALTAPAAATSAPGMQGSRPSPQRAAGIPLISYVQAPGAMIEPSPAPSHLSA
jgi:hypothetical protein